MVRRQIVAVILLIAVESSYQVYRPDMGRPMIIQPTYRPDTGRPTIIHPTYKPGTGRIIYAKRDVSQQKDEPDVNVPENYDINKLKQVNVPERFPRSVDSPSAKRGGGGSRTSGGNRDTGPTHPGYNRRNTRSAEEEPIWLWKGDNIDRAPATGDHPFLPKYIDDIKLDPNRRYTRSADEDPMSKTQDAIPSGFEHGDAYIHLEDPSINYEDVVEEERLSHRDSRSVRLPFPDPYRPTMPTPYNPFPKPYDPRPFPVYARHRRDVQFPGMKKPTHRDVIIPNWNPNVKTNPWDVIKGRKY